jgi:uncharacterized protein YndB with AHSA1/START domain
VARYCATVTTQRPIAEVFAYLADFRNVAEWDPSIVESVLISDAEAIGVGARFRVTAKTTISQVVLEYETTRLERPHLVGLRGENESVISVDTITLTEDGSGGCAVTYEAVLELKGIRKLADSLLELGFRRLGDRAAHGLAEELGGQITGRVA